MSRERIDHETMAAFLDGKLAGAERERVLRIIAENPEEYEVFADAARAAAELRGGEVVPIESRRRFGGWKVAVPLLAAAGLAAVLLVPRLGGRSALLPGELADRLTLVSQPGPGSLAIALGRAWDQPGWSVMRGSAVDLTEPAHAFRLGARATDVEIAVRAGDTTALATVGAELIELLSGVDAGAASAAQYRAILAAGPAASAADRSGAAESLRALMGRTTWFDLGAWVEAVRVAALAGRDAELRSLWSSLPEFNDTEPVEGVRAAVGPKLVALEPLITAATPNPENRQRILDLLTDIIVTAGR